MYHDFLIDALSLNITNFDKTLKFDQLIKKFENLKIIFFFIY